jgi:hypothetical protein
MTLYASDPAGHFMLARYVNGEIDQPLGYLKVGRRHDDLPIIDPNQFQMKTSWKGKLHAKNHAVPMVR